MNERIRELAEQAKNFMTDQVLYQSRVHNRTLSVDESADIFEEKFAELIVRECVECARSVGDLRGTNDDMIYGLDVAAVQIVKHFGIDKKE